MSLFGHLHAQRSQRFRHPESYDNFVVSVGFVVCKFHAHDHAQRLLSKLIKQRYKHNF